MLKRSQYNVSIQLIIEFDQIEINLIILFIFILRLKISTETVGFEPTDAITHH